jgi:hypothetical protein
MWQAQLPTTTELLRGKHNNIPPPPPQLPPGNSKTTANKREEINELELFYKLTSSQNNELKVFLLSTHTQKKWKSPNPISVCIKISSFKRNPWKEKYFRLRSSVVQALYHRWKEDRIIIIIVIIILPSL